MNRETIKSVLQAEVSDLRSGDQFGVICGLILSVSFVSLSSLGIYCYLFDPHPIGMVLVPVLALVASYVLGAQLHGSDKVYGADVSDYGVKRYSEASTWWGQDRGMDYMETGMYLMAAQFMMCGVYETAKYLREKKQGQTGSHSGDIAAVMVHHLVEKNSADQNALLALPELQSYPVPEVKQVLVLLNRQGILESTPKGFWIAGAKKYLFN